MTPLGQLPFFIDFLKAAGLFDALVADCPLRYLSRTRPGSGTFSARRCCPCSPATSATRISWRCCDAVLPELLERKKIVSEDAIRRAFKAIDETEGTASLRGYLAFSLDRHFGRLAGEQV